MSSTTAVFSAESATVAETILNATEGRLETIFVRYPLWDVSHEGPLDVAADTWASGSDRARMAAHVRRDG